MSEFSESLPSLHQRPIERFFFIEHPRHVLLVGHQLCQEDVHLGLVHLVEIAEEDEQVIGFLEGYVEIAEELDIPAELVENQVSVYFYFFVKFRFF